MENEETEILNKAEGPSSPSGNTTTAEESADDLVGPYDFEAFADMLGNVDNATEEAIDEDSGPKAFRLFNDAVVDNNTEHFGNQIEDIVRKTDKKELKTMELDQIDSTELSTLAKRYSTQAAVYGQPINEAQAADLQDSTGGMIWQAKIYRDGYANKNICTSDSVSTKQPKLKALRPIPIVYESDFFNSLTFTKNKWVFQGKLNGWPGLTNLELIALEYWYEKKVGPTTVKLSKLFWSKHGEDDLQLFDDLKLDEKHTRKSKVKDKEKSTMMAGSVENEPKYPGPGYFFFKKKPISIRATLRAPKYTEHGYNKGNPGFLFWFFQNYSKPRMFSGEQIIEDIKRQSDEQNEPIAKAVTAHFYGHRYAKAKESAKDLLTYHTGLLIEWDHGKYCTMVELAYLYGLGGYGGKSNWVEDRDAPGKPLLYNCMPDYIKCPWKSNRSEIRMIDMNVKNLEEFEQYLTLYSTHKNPKENRFIKPSIKYSAPIRLSMNSADSLVRFLINYGLRDTSYSEEFHNCQSFAADFFSFLCAKPTVEPFYPVKMLYKERRHLFLYQPQMFSKKKRNVIGKKVTMDKQSKENGDAIKQRASKNIKGSKSDKKSGGLLSNLFGQ